MKPENIMLGDFGSVLVMDWGLAKVVGQTPRPDSELVASLKRSVVMSARSVPGSNFDTAAGTIMGTPQYMAPEQARADIYALGAILFEMLHLHPTVTGGDIHELVGKVQRGEIEWPLEKKRAGIPHSLLTVCRKALALDPTHRYEHVEALQQDLAAY